jgi:ribonuclease P protein component
MKPDFSFSKQERLKSEKLISRLFKDGKSYMAYPIRVVWMPIEPSPDFPSPAQIAISVPKRVFKTAVSRNKIKRQIREAWRVQKHVFYEKIQEKELNIVMMFVYVAKEGVPFEEIESGVKKVLRKFEIEKDAKA